jgi:hypothetical protein
MPRCRSKAPCKLCRPAISDHLGPRCMSMAPWVGTYLRAYQMGRRIPDVKYVQSRFARFGYFPCPRVQPTSLLFNNPISGYDLYTFSSVGVVSLFGGHRLFPVSYIVYPPQVSYVVPTIFVRLHCPPSVASFLLYRTYVQHRERGNHLSLASSAQCEPKSSLNPTPLSIRPLKAPSSTTLHRRQFAIVLATMCRFPSRSLALQHHLSSISSPWQRWRPMIESRDA